MAGPTTARRGGSELSPSGPPPEQRRTRGPRPPDSGPGAGPLSRLRARLRLPRPSPRAVLLCLVAAALLSAGAVWLLYSSSWLRVEQVRASGTGVLTQSEVERAAAVPLDTPMVSVDTDEVAARLRSALPRIAAVEVERSWPHTIGLEVTERKPELLIEKGGKFIEVDAGGVRFATAESAPEGVPLLKMDADDSPSLRRFGEGRLEREAVRVAAGLPEVIHRDVRVIRVRSYDSITLELTRGRTVVWGSGERGAAKSKTLVALMKTARDADRFDVSAPSAPAVSGS